VIRSLTVLALGLLVSLVIHAPVACSFEPTKISIRPNPQIILCPPPGGTSTVTVTIEGTISFADQQAQEFEIRLVDEDTFADDLLGRHKFKPAEGDEWVAGETRTFTTTFEVKCNNRCNVEGIESSGEEEADLALEIDSGRVSRSGNYYDTTTNNTVSVMCSKHGVPTLTEWGLIALAVLLAGSLAFMIRRRLAPRPAGA
jgi:hypothetical protein